MPPKKLLILSSLSGQSSPAIFRPSLWRYYVSKFLRPRCPYAFGHKLRLDLNGPTILTPPNTDSDSDDSDSRSDCCWDSISDCGLDISFSGLSDGGHGPDEPEDGNFYLALIQGYEEEGPTLADRGESAKKMVAAEETKWRT